MLPGGPRLSRGDPLRARRYDSLVYLLMAILTLGVSFRRAPIELLERLAFTDDDLAKAYRTPSTWTASTRP